MTRLYLLDTNTVIYILKGKSPAARSRLANLGENEVVYVSTVTEAELNYGLAKGGTSPQRRTALDWFLARLHLADWGRNEAAAYGSLRAQQELMGKPLGALDTLIAAHALALGAVLVTNDRAFAHVEGLAGLENWATDLS